LEEGREGKKKRKKRKKIQKIKIFTLKCDLKYLPYTIVIVVIHYDKM